MPPCNMERVDSRALRAERSGIDGGSSPLNINQIARVVSGKRVSSVHARTDAQFEIEFQNGARLVIRSVGGALSVGLADEGDRTCPLGTWPTIRQREYLEFIAKYIGRFGRSPAETDIQRHFLVSAPSVNHMVQGLERRGFIECQQAVPRSIRIVGPDACAKCGDFHHRNASGVRRSARRDTTARLSLRRNN